MPGLLDVILGYDCNLACDYCCSRSSPPPANAHGRGAESVEHFGRNTVRTGHAVAHDREDAITAETVRVVATREYDGPREGHVHVYLNDTDSEPLIMTTSDDVQVFSDAFKLRRDD